MKILKITLFILLIITTASIEARSQNDYATMDYWGQKIQLDRSFFEILNGNYQSFLENNRRSKHYDFQEYSTLFNNAVMDLKRYTFIITVTESYQLNATHRIYMPGFEESKDKKQNYRANRILFDVLLPSLKDYYKKKS